MKTLRVEFDEYPDEWWEVVVSPVPLGDFDGSPTLFGLMGLVADLTMTPASFKVLYAAFLPFVQAWSHKGKPSVATMLRVDYKTVLAVIGAWVDGVRSAPRPLPRASSAGEPSATTSPPS